MIDLRKFAETASAVLEEPEPAEYTWKMKIAVALHDLVAHPLLWITHDAGWAWAFHDWLGEIAMRGAADSTGIRITGAGMQQAINALRSLGWEMTSYSPRMSEIHSPMQSATSTWRPPGPVTEVRGDLGGVFAVDGLELSASHEVNVFIDPRTAKIVQGKWGEHLYVQRYRMFIRITDRESLSTICVALSAALKNTDESER